MTTSAKRVLIVDDDALIGELLGSMLRQRDLTVDEAADGREAVELLQENIYSVVLLDLLMPNVDGFTVLEALTSAPVVLVITAADRALVKRLDPKKIHGIVRKPFDAEELANLVVACTEIRSRSVFETMAIPAMIAPAGRFSWLNRLT